MWSSPERAAEARRNALPAREATVAVLGSGCSALGVNRLGQALSSSSPPAPFALIPLSPPALVPLLRGGT